VDIAQLELNTLKMAFNLTFKDLREEVIPAILKHAESRISGERPEVISKWFLVVKKFVHSNDDERDVIDIMVQHLLQNRSMLPEISIFLKSLFDIEVLEEDCILDWYDSLGNATGELKRVKEAV
jgi:translation initiation factor eIF-2B subunit epsilon